MFHSSNNWRRLLNLNPALTPDPTALMGDGNLVLLGSIYTIEPGDSLASIAGAFGGEGLGFGGLVLVVRG